MIQERNILRDMDKDGIIKKQKATIEQLVKALENLKPFVTSSCMATWIIEQSLSEMKND